MDGREQIGIRPRCDHGMVVIIHRDLSSVTAAFKSQDDVRLALVLAIEKLAQFCGSRFDLLQLRRSQLYLLARIRDSHVPSNLETLGARRDGRRLTRRRPGAAYFRVRLWCVDGIFMSSRYFATVRRVTSIPWDCSSEVI